MVALTGTETLVVNGVDNKGFPAGVSQTVTTSQIASLAGAGTSPSFTNVTLSGYLYESNGTAVTPYSGGGQTNAAALPYEVNRITSSVGTSAPFDSVKLPTSAGGLSIVIMNLSSNPIQVFGSSTDTINGVATATGVTQAPNSVETYWCPVAGVWYADLGAGFTGSLFTELTQDNITAAAAGTQAGATVLYAQTNRITTAANTSSPFSSVKLPASAPGLEVLVINHGANSIQVFGSGTDTINDVATATGVTQMAGSFAIYSCSSTGLWYTEGLGTGYAGSLQTFSYQDGMSAAGTTQGTATAITTIQARFTTVAAGSGAVLPTAAAGLAITVINAGANPLIVYPATNQYINALAQNTGFVVPAGGVAEFFTTTNNIWHTVLTTNVPVPVLYTTNTATASATLTAANITGGTAEVDLALTGTLAAAGAATLPTVSTILPLIPNAAVNQTYKLRIINASAGAFTWTVTTNTGWTLSGTMTIAQNTWRDFIVTITSVSGATATLQSIGTGTYS